jgi:PAS domain S-box-containing protein
VRRALTPSPRLALIAFAVIGGAAVAFQVAAPFTTGATSGRLAAAAWIAAATASLATGLVVTLLTSDRGLYGAWSLWCAAAFVWMTGAVIHFAVPHSSTGDLVADVLWCAFPVLAIASIARDTTKGSLSLGLFLVDALPLVLFLTLALRLDEPGELAAPLGIDTEYLAFAILYLLLALVGLQMLWLEKSKRGTPNIWGFGMAQPVLAAAALLWPEHWHENAGPAPTTFRDALWTIGFLLAAWTGVARARRANDAPELLPLDDSLRRIVPPAAGTIGIAILALSVPQRYEAIPLLFVGISVGCLAARALVVQRAGSRVQARLRENERKFRTLVDNIPGAVYRCAFDPDWTIEYVSDDIEAITGYPASGFLGSRETTWRTIEHPDDADAFAEHIRACLGARKPFDYVYRIVRAEGEIRWVQDRGQAVYAPNGRVRWIDGILLDVTDHRRAEEHAARQSRLLELLQTVAVAANEARRNEDALRVSLEAICAHTRWPVGHVLLREGRDGPLVSAGIWHLDEPDRYEAFRAASEELSFQDDDTLPGDVLASGEPDWIASVEDHLDAVRPVIALEAGLRSALAFPVLAGSEVAAVLEFWAAEPGAPSPETLEFMANIGKVLGRVFERTRAERFLAEQNESLRELDRLKDEFVSLVSHELRTPLTSIRGYLELALEDVGTLTSDQREYLAVVQRNSERLLRLVGDLLFVAQVDAGRLQIDHEPADLAAIARESVQGAEPVAAGRGVGLSIEAGPAPLDGDAARLAQLVDNLVSNAIKFTEPGGTVTVRVRAEADAAVLEVSDSGIGIPAEEQEQLFERFFRSSNARRAAIQGTGLGLVIVRAIADAHGGAVSMESAEHVGTTFRVELPARLPQTDVESAPMREVA